MTTPAGPDATRIPPGQAAPAGGGGSFFTQRYGPLPGWGWIAVIALAVGGYILYRRSKTTTTANAASTAPATTASQTASAGTTAEDNCTDASGNAVPCTEADYSSQIAALQAEIDNLQGTPSVPSSTVAAAGTTSSGTGASTSTTGATTSSTGGVAPVTTTPTVTVPPTTPTTTTAK